MSSEPQPSDDLVPTRSTTTHVYGADGNWLRDVGPFDKGTSIVYDGAGRAVGEDSSVPPVVRVRAALPLRVEVFEFRLAGSEAKQARKQLSDLGPWAVAARSIRAYHTRESSSAAGASVISGLEVVVGLEDDGLVCQATLSDGVAGELVVVQVEVAVYRVAA